MSKRLLTKKDIEQNTILKLITSYLEQLDVDYHKQEIRSMENTIADFEKASRKQTEQRLIRLHIKLFTTSKTQLESLIQCAIRLKEIMQIAKELEGSSPFVTPGGHFIH